jgi:hypothetical protein
VFVKGNIKKILKLRDQRDYKDKVKKMFKQMYNDCQKKYEKNVRKDGITSDHILFLEKNSTIRVERLLSAFCRSIKSCLS